jgi:ribonuclease R
MEEAGAWTSGRERDAMVIERTADDIARGFLLERFMFENGFDTVFDGEVIGVIGAGAFVAFGSRVPEAPAGAPEAGPSSVSYQGLLPVRKLRGDWWELNEEGTLLRGSESGKAIRLGDPVQVRVERVETARGRVDLVPVD